MKIIDIHRYLSDEASEEEKQKLERWLAKSRENRQQFERYRKIYNVEIGYKFHYDKQAALENFRKVMNRDEIASKTIKARNNSERVSYSTGFWLKIAAVLIVTVATSLYVINTLETQPQETIAEAQRGVTIQTAPGEQKSFKLGDGSRVKLNAASGIFIPPGFGNDSRDVELTGEALFEIVSGHDHAFRVKTKTARIAVLGTSFTVRAWEERDESVIAVQSGQVSVQSVNPETEDYVYLNAGEYTRVMKDESPTPALQANIDQFTGWTNQMFVFDETPLRDVIKQLELHFNVQIIIEDSLSINDPVTARYRNETLREILEYTSITHEVDFKVKSHSQP